MRPTRFLPWLALSLLLAACGGGGGGAAAPLLPPEAPRFSVPAGTYTAPVAVAISTPTAGAEIRYTTDGTTPTEGYGTPYAGVPVAVEATATLRAVACVPGSPPSPVSSATYTITGTVASPVYSLSPGSYTHAQLVAISTATPGASIRYTRDGSDPSSTHGTPYTSAIPLGEDSMTVFKAVAYKAGWADSAMSHATYTITGTVAAPSFGITPGTYTTPQAVTLYTATAGASLRYTTDGSAPSRTNGSTYAGPITLGLNSSTTIRAVAVRDGWLDSPVSSGTYAITGTVSAPSFSPAPGSYTSAQGVFLSSATEGATIRYTTDGSVPDRAYGLVYSGPIFLGLNGTVTIRAVAYRDGWADSPVSSGTFVVTGTVAAPAFGTTPGTYFTPRSVSLSSATGGAVIRYTVDGTTPTSTTGSLYTGPIPLPSGTSTTIRAIASKAGWADSPVASGAFTITGFVATPAFDPAPGTFPSPVSVAISSATPGAAIRYTTDGSTPSATNGLAYLGPIPLPSGSVTTIRAIGLKADWGESPVASGTFTITGTVSAPAFSPVPGNYTSLRTVTLSSATPEAAIYYTTDGSTPSAATAIPYTGPIPLGGAGSALTIRAIACRPGWADSPPSSGRYAVNGILAAGGLSHTLLVQRDGSLWAWGGNDNGQIGDNSTVQRNRPVQVALSDVRYVAAGRAHSLALRGDGTVWAWGANNRGQLGDNTTTGRLAPAQVPGLAGITAVAAGDEYSLALRGDGTVFAWGVNQYGQLGDGTTADRWEPAQLPFLTGVIAVTAGSRHAVALRSDGVPWAWGWNLRGQLGDNTTTSRLVPGPVVGISGVVSVSSGYAGAHTLALRSDGSVWGWGYGDMGGVGDGLGGDHVVPVRAQGMYSGCTAVTAGSNHSLALMADGTVRGWGWNGYGQVGDNATTTRYSPVEVPGIVGVARLGAGGQHSLAFSSDGTAWAWGWNNRGQLGDNTTTDRHLPTQVMADGLPLSGLLAAGVGGAAAPSGGGGGCSVLPGASGTGAPSAAAAAALLIPALAALRRHRREKGRRRR